MTTETKFTPGPWSRDDATIYTSAKDGGNRFGAWFTRGFDDNGRRIENSEVVANATLAQAAPDMYAALEDARAIAMRMAAKADIPHCAEFGTIAQILDAALAKAEGKP